MINISIVVERPLRKRIKS